MAEYPGTASADELHVVSSGPLSATGPLGAIWGRKATHDSLESLLAGARDRLSIRPADDVAWRGVAPASVELLVDQASAERGSPWPHPLVSHYSRYFRDGNRTAYEGMVGARQQRLTRAVVMSALHRDAEEWLDEVVDGAYLLCEQSSWSWAAHDDVFAVSGDVVPDPDRPYVDLGAGEVAAQLAWIDLVLGDRLDQRAPGLRRRLRYETQRRVIQPFVDRLDWHWLGLDGDVHNWNPWIHSNIITAALLLVDDPKLQAHTISRCIEGLDRFLASIPDDGAIDEGFAYWWNGAGRALEGLAVLDEASGRVLAADVPVVREMVAFPHRMHLGDRWFLNVADGPARAAEGLPWDMLYRAAIRTGDTQAAQNAGAFVREQVDSKAGLGRVLHSLLQPVPGPVSKAVPGLEQPERLEQPDEQSPQPPLAAFTYLPSVQIMVARQIAGSARGLTLTAKGGHNGEHHNHRDVGSLVVAVDGVPLLVDAGQPTYTAQTFGPDRYQIRAMQSSWHSVPAPFGLEQGTGAEFGATVIEEPTAARPTLTLGLGTAYGFARAEQWIRTAALNREVGSIVIGDRWELPTSPNHQETHHPDIDIAYLIAGTLQLGNGGTGEDGTATVWPEGIPGIDTSGAAPVPGHSSGLRLRWKPRSAVVLVDEWVLDDPLLKEIWGTKLTRLRFRLPVATPATGEFTVSMEATNE
ncbi:heparinase [Arthrobacter sp. TWP1-1]|uniref:heparinase n=1 Tax=Arthrobacter sp. TWP1-1 TaxID=2804568 RepID=UPI003CECF57D